MIKEKALEWSGTVNVNTIADAKIVKTEILHNQITNVALNALINALDNIDPNLELKYIAIGTDDSPLDPSDTTLGTEIFRASVDTSNNNATGEFTTTFTILDSEAVGSWREIAFFCGDSATASANTGIMLSRLLYSREKTNSEEIQFSRVDSISRS